MSVEYFSVADNLQIVVRSDDGAESLLIDLHPQVDELAYGVPAFLATADHQLHGEM